MPVGTLGIGVAYAGKKKLALPYVGRAGLSSSTLWTPLALGSALAAWIDPSDASTITFNGSNIASIASKGGTGVAWAQSTGARQPGNVGNAINFGSAASLIPNAWPSGAYDAVFGGKARTSGSYQTLLQKSPNAYQYILQAPSYNVCVYGPYSQFGSQTWPGGTSGLAHLAAPTSGNLSASRDGAALAINSQGIPTNVIDNIGNDAGTNTNGFGDIYEFIVSNRALTQGEYQKCEGYIAWHRSRLGDPSLVTALVAGHPYKSAAPTQ